MPGDSLKFALANLSDYSMLARDPLDHAVYAHAQARFWREVATFNISDTSCVSASNRTADQPQISSCNGGGIRLDARTVNALSFARLFPAVRRRFVEASAFENRAEPT